MQIPAAAFIEQALDDITQRVVPESVLIAQAKELDQARAFVSGDYSCGYQLGLQTARKMIAASVAVQQSNIKPEDIL